MAPRQMAKRIELRSDNQDEKAAAQLDGLVQHVKPYEFVA